MKKSNKRTDVKSRDDITRTVEQSGTDLREKVGDLDKLEKDVQTIRDTLANLECGGTAEGADAVDQAITGAEDITVEIFDREDGALGEIQSESEGHEQELNEHSDSEHSDVEKLSEASSRVSTNETINEMVKAKEAALQDIDFLMEQIRRVKEARDDSEKTQQGYQGTVHGTGS